MRQPTWEDTNASPQLQTPSLQQLPQLLWGSGCPKPSECHEQLAGAVLGNDACCCCYCCCKIGRIIAIFMLLRTAVLSG
jgi:hypothetical protein